MKPLFIECGRNNYINLNTVMNIKYETINPKDTEVVIYYLSGNVLNYKLSSKEFQYFIGDFKNAMV